MEIEYLFSWDEIPGKDSDKLVEFLRDYDVKWVKKARIEKIDNGNAIKIFTEKKSLLLKLNNEKTKASIEIDDVIWDFIVKEENGNLNIYHKIFTEEDIEDMLKRKQVLIGTEEDLIKFIRENPNLKFFWDERLKEKIEWEKEDWNLINSNIGKKINPEILKKIFDKIGGWWGYLLKGPNPKRIFSTPNDRLNNWFNYLLNGNEPESVRIEKCIVDPKYKVNGAHIGLVTLLLYLKNPNSFNVMMPPTIRGLEILGRFDSKRGKRRWRDYYNDYNKAANDFRDRYELEPQSLDFVLDVIKRNYQRTDDGIFYYEEVSNEDAAKIVIVHVTKDLIKKALDELGKTKSLRNELIPKMNEIVEREGKTLVDDETAWKEIQDLNEGI